MRGAGNPPEWARVERRNFRAQFAARTFRYQAAKAAAVTARP